MAEAALLGELVSSLAEGVMVFDADGQLLLMNPAANDLLPSGLGWLVGERGQGAAKVRTVDDERRLSPSELPLPRALKGETTRGLEVIVPGGDEPVRYVRLAGWPLAMGDGPSAGAVLTIEDVGERVRSQRLAAEADERFRFVFDHAPVGMALVQADRQSARLLQANATLCGLLGRPERALCRLSFDELVAEPDAAIAAVLLSDLLSERASAPQTELRMTCADGSTIWVGVTAALVRGPRGRARYAVLQIQDTSQRRAFEERLQHLADHDPLTGLVNRRRLQEELGSHQQRCLRYGAKGSLVLLDLDGFKDVNDTLGHGVGDQVLRDVAAALTERLRESDVVARLGGDEFAVLLPNTEVEDAVTVAGQLVERVARNVGEGRDGAMRISACAGVAPFSGGALRGRDLLAEADVALYEAKDAGRGAVARYRASGQRERIASRLTWANRITDALHGEGFELLAQPILTYSGRVTAAHELLLRLRGQKGLALPRDFLPVAEHFGSMRAIDDWVLREAVGLLGDGPDLGTIHVNVSTASLIDPEFAAGVEQAIQESGADPRRLMLEITETAAISNMERARALVERVRRLGCLLALDDFGAGFASFYYLKHLPVDVIKIDGEFVRDMASSELSRTVVRAIVQVASTLGCRTVAECIETPETFRLAQELGVHAAQGWHVGRPAPLPAAQLD